MTQTIYTYLISATANNAVCNEGLQTEIQNSDIVTALDAVDTNQTDINVVFKDALSTGDKTLLDTIVSIHAGKHTAFEVQEVKIVEEGVDPSERTHGHYYSKGFKFDIPATIGDHEETFSFPYPVTVMAMEIIPIPEWKADEISIIVAPETIVGALTANVTAGDSTLNVSSTVIENMYEGFYVTVTDGVNKETLGHAVNVDAINGTIDVTGTAVNSYLASSPTYVSLSVAVVDHFHIHGVYPIIFGDVKIGGTYLKAGTPFKIVYHNDTGTAKTFHFTMEVLY